MGILAVQLIRKGGEEQLTALIGAAGSFAAVSFIFGSPLIGAVILIEAAALDRRGLQVVLPVGLLASGIGALVSTGIGAWDGLSSSDFALDPLAVPDFARPDLSDFPWTIPFALAIALVVFAIFAAANRLQPLVMGRPFLLIPAAGLVVAGLAIAFSEATGKDVSYVLFSGQDSIGPLFDGADTWSVSALALLLAFKGLAWSVSLSGFRGGPTFPGLLLGVAAGLLATHLPGFATTPGRGGRHGRRDGRGAAAPAGGGRAGHAAHGARGRRRRAADHPRRRRRLPRDDRACTEARIRATARTRRGRAARARRAARRPSRDRAGRAAPR